MTPTEFEHQIARIQSALVGNNAKVKWNDRFPDPDNPSQLRQVDITIRKEKTLTLVECRLHSRPQDVKWIEELYGRKASLNADMVIGVSSQGFTRGAIEKARRLGVVLRSLSELSEPEIKSWGKRSKVTISHLKFSKLQFLVVASDLVILPHVGYLDLLYGPEGKPFDFNSAFATVAKKLADEGHPEGPFTIQLHLTDTTLGSVLVTEAIFSAEFKWVYRDVRLPSVIVYTNPHENSAESLIEKNSYSRSEIHHTPNGAFPIIDISSVVDLGAQFVRRITIDFGKNVVIKGVSIVGLNETPPALSKFEFGIITRSSSEYRNFQRRFC